MTHLDFAAAWAETEAEPITVRVSAFDLPGVQSRRARVWRWLTRRPDPNVHVLPGGMPAGLRLHMWAVQQHTDDTSQLSYGDLKAAGRYLFGVDTFQRWLDARMTEDQLTEMVMMILAVYAAREAEHRDPDGSGKAEGASAAPPTSSTTSPSSKPTSTGSTDETSPLISVLTD